jgi:hypothetical protein
MLRAPVLRKNLTLARSLTGPRDKTIRLTFIQTSLPERSGRNRGIRVRGGDELGQIGTNEFFPQLIRRQIWIFRIDLRHRAFGSTGQLCATLHLRRNYWK